MKFNKVMHTINQNLGSVVDYLFHHEFHLTTFITIKLNSTNYNTTELRQKCCAVRSFIDIGGAFFGNCVVPLVCCGTASRQADTACASCAPWPRLGAEAITCEHSATVYCNSHFIIEGTDKFFF